MISSCLGLNAVNCLLLNKENLKSILDLMSSASNHSRLDAFGVDVFNMHETLEHCLEKTFKSERDRKKYKAAQARLRSEEDAAVIAKLDAEIQELQATSEMCYTFNFKFSYEESYLLLWHIYATNYKISFRKILEDGNSVNLFVHLNDVLYNILLELPKYGIVNDKLFNKEIYKIANMTEDRFRSLIKFRLGRVGSENRKFRYSELEFTMSNILSELTKYQKLIGVQPNEGVNIQQELDTLRTQFGALDSGELVISLLRSPNLLKSYSLLFNKDLDAITRLVNQLNKEKLVAIYEDMHPEIWGLNVHNIAFFDKAYDSVTFTTDVVRTVDNLSKFMDIVQEAEIAIDSASSLLKPIVKGV